MKIEVIERRRSIRRFKEDAVPAEMIVQILEAARQAPSAKNAQPWRFLVLGAQSRAIALDAMDAGIRRRMETAEHRKLLADTIHTLRIMRHVPALMLIVNPTGGNPTDGISGLARVAELLDAMSVGAAVENLLLEAAALGLGALWIGNTFFAYDEITSALGIQGHLLGAIALGWPDEAPEPRPRKPMAETAAFLP